MDILTIFEPLFLRFIFHISILFLSICLYATHACAQDSSLNTQPIQDTSQLAISTTRYTLIDTLFNPLQVRWLFMPYEKISNSRNNNLQFELQIARKLPNAKQIKTHATKNKRTYFIALLFLIILVSITRLSNPKNFNIFIQSVFDSQLNQRMWNDSKSNFYSIIIQLSISFIFTLSIIIAYYLQSRSEMLLLSFIDILWRTVAIIFSIYIIKFFMLWLLGTLLNFSFISQGVITHTISVNGFISLIMLPLSVVYIYNSNFAIGNTAFYTLIAVFFIGIIFRNVRMFIMALNVSSFPIIYLFIYICALEILPWLLLFKILDKYIV